MTKVGNVLTKIFHWVFFLLSLFLFVSSVFVTATHEKTEGYVQEFAKVTLNNLPLTLILLGVGIACVFAFYKISETVSKKHTFNIEVIALTVTAITFVLSVVWISILNIVPGADQEFCVQRAIEINNGDYSSFAPGGYLSNYPHLLGTVAILRFFFRLFGEGNYEAFRYFNAICVPIFVYSGYRFTKKLSGDNHRIELFYLLSALFCIPMYGYVLFVYGDLGGPCFGMMTFWMFLEALDSKKIGWKIGLFFSLSMSIVLRKSNFIFAIAMLLVLIVRAFVKFKKSDLLMLATLAVTVVFAFECVNWPYLPNKVDPEYAVPVSANIAMGLNYDYGFAGWYNYYELKVMADNDFVKKAASREASALVKEYLSVYLQNPKLGAQFFFNKICSQWESPLYQSIVSNNLLYGGQNAFVMSVFTGKIGVVFEYFMKMYQMLFYGLVTLWLFKNRRANLPIAFYSTMIATFGGFLLSLVWESKGRYIFPYFLIMIPIYAIASYALNGKRKKDDLTESVQV